MQKISKTVLLTFLMVILGLSAATNSLNESTETTVLDEISTPQEVILPIASLNQPGQQEGSIFSDTTLSLGKRHSCVILDNGSVSCWGDAGLPPAPPWSSYPRLTESFGLGRTAVALGSGFGHTCAILDNGSVSCWGDGNYGQLGNGGYSDRFSPTLTSSLGTGRTAVALS